MTKKQKKTLNRIIAAAVLTVLLAAVFHFTALPWFVQLALWLVPYFIIGHDVLRKYRCSSWAPPARPAPLPPAGGAAERLS